MKSPWIVNCGAAHIFKCNCFDLNLPNFGREMKLSLWECNSGWGRQLALQRGLGDKGFWGAGLLGRGGLLGWRGRRRGLLGWWWSSGLGFTELEDSLCFLHYGRAFGCTFNYYIKKNMKSFPNSFKAVHKDRICKDYQLFFFYLWIIFQIKIWKIIIRKDLINNLRFPWEELLCFCACIICLSEK